MCSAEFNIHQLSRSFVWLMWTFRLFVFVFRSQFDESYWNILFFSNSALSISSTKFSYLFGDRDFSFDWNNLLKRFLSLFPSFFSSFSSSSLLKHCIPFESSFKSNTPSMWNSKNENSVYLSAALISNRKMYILFFFG